MSIRRLWPVERALVPDHLLRLDSEDRRFRFFQSINDTSIIDYCERIDWAQTAFFGFFDKDDLRGMAELVLPRAACAGEAEIALTVERSYRNRGIGSDLVHRALAHARNRHIGNVHLSCLYENASMRFTAAKCGGRATFEDGILNFVFSVAGAEGLSHASDKAQDGEVLPREEGFGSADGDEIYSDGCDDNRREVGNPANRCNMKRIQA